MEKKHTAAEDAERMAMPGGGTPIKGAPPSQVSFSRSAQLKFVSRLPELT
jgi:hypothetical protein